MKRAKVLIGVVISGVVLTGWILYKLRPVTPERKLVTTVDAYLASVLEVSHTTPIIADPAAYGEFRIAAVLRAAAPYAGLNAETQRIWAQAQESARGILTERHNGLIMHGGKKPAIMLVPRPIVYTIRAEGGHADAFYNFVDGVLYLPDLEMPDVWQAQLFYHEYGHAFQALVDHLGDAVLGEVLMRTLSTQIISAGVPGYTEKILGIVRRSKRGTYKDAIASIRVQDLRDLDRMIFPTPDHTLSISSAMHHVLAVGFAFIDEREAGNLETKKNVYTWVQSARDSQR